MALFYGERCHHLVSVHAASAAASASSRSTFICDVFPTELYFQYIAIFWQFDNGLGYSLLFGETVSETETG